MASNRRTSSTSQTFDGPWEVTYQRRKWSWRGRLARWYFRHFIIPGRCFCTWHRYRVKFLVRLCGRIDDAYCNEQFKDFAHFHMTGRT